MRQFKQILIAVFAVALMGSCKTAYEKVAQDRYRTKTERDLLAKPCSDEFPPKLGEPKIVREGVDSSDYFSALEAYGNALDENLALKDSLIAVMKLKYPGIDSVVKQVPKEIRERDSLRIIRNFMKTYRPKPIIKEVVKEVPVQDSAANNEWQRLLNTCRNNEQDALKKAEQAVKWKKYFWICAASFAAFIILLIVFLVKQKTKRAVPTP
jgi:hypothetical protein